jgi:choline dehydrogenase-like flavoprotein
MTDHYDVIIIGSGAGGGTLTYALAPTGKRILLLERGDTLVVAPGLVVDKVYVGYWFWGRPSPFQLWEDLQDLLRRTKDDFDPTTERARATWMTANAAQLTAG